MLEWVSGAVPLGDVGEAFSGEVPVDPAAFHALGALVADLHTKVASLERGKPVGCRCVGRRWPGR